MSWSPKPATTCRRWARSISTFATARTSSKTERASRRVKKRKELDARIDELHAKIADWKKTRRFARAISTRAKPVCGRSNRSARPLGKAAAAEEGSFFKYTVLEVRESLSTDPTVQQQFRAYYKKVDDTNRSRLRRSHAAARAAWWRFVRGGRRVRVVPPGPKAVWDKDSARARLRDDRGPVQRVQPRLRELSRHRLRAARRQNVTHVEEAEERAVRDLSRPVVEARRRRHAREAADPRPGTDKCTTCHHPPHVHVRRSREAPRNPRPRPRFIGLVLDLCEAHRQPGSSASIVPSSATSSS